MIETFRENQARVDLLFAAGRHIRPSPAGAATDRLLAQAKRGLDNPGSLSRAEMQEVCAALVVHYAQMGIG